MSKQLANEFHESQRRLAVAQARVTASRRVIAELNRRLAELGTAGPVDRSV